MSEAGAGARLARIVEEASALILPLWRTGLNVDTKTDDSPVTEADRRAEALIIARLKTEFPDVPVIAEEESSADGVPLSIARRFFLVDPLGRSARTAASRSMFASATTPTCWP